MNESIFQAENRVYQNTHCGACDTKVETPGDLGWMTIRHPSGKINQFEHLCDGCCVRLADFFELLQCKVEDKKTQRKRAMECHPDRNPR